jgi:hypothetical protein
VIFLELEASYATSCTLIVPELKSPRNNHSNMACPCGHAKVTVPQQLQILNQHHYAFLLHKWEGSTFSVCFHPRER